MNTQYRLLKESIGSVAANLEKVTQSLEKYVQYNTNNSNLAKAKDNRERSRERRDRERSRELKDRERRDRERREAKDRERHESSCERDLPISKRSCQRNDDSLFDGENSGRFDHLRRLMLLIRQQ